MADGRPTVTRTIRMLGIALLASTALSTAAVAQRDYSTPSATQSTPQGRSPDQPQQQKSSKGSATVMLGSKKVSLNPEFAKIYDDLVKTAESDPAGAPAKVAAAHAAAKSPEEHYLAYQLELKVAMAKKDEGGMGKAVQGMLSTGVAPQD